MDVRLLFFTYPAEKIVARVDRSKAEMLSPDTLLRNWRILTSWSGRGVVIISDTDNFSDINDFYLWYFHLVPFHVQNFEFFIIMPLCNYLIKTDPFNSIRDYIKPL